MREATSWFLSLAFVLNKHMHSPSPLLPVSTHVPARVPVQDLPRVLFAISTSNAHARSSRPLSLARFNPPSPGEYVMMCQIFLMHDLLLFFTLWTVCTAELDDGRHHSLRFALPLGRKLDRCS